MAGIRELPLQRYLTVKTVHIYAQVKSKTNRADNRHFLALFINPTWQQFIIRKFGYLDSRKFVGCRPCPSAIFTTVAP